MKDSAVTNGPKGTIFIRRKLPSPYSVKTIEINSQFTDDVCLETLVMIQVENLHTVSHFKH